jgi:hypothetical protein
MRAAATIVANARGTRAKFNLALQQILPCTMATVEGFILDSNHIEYQ